ncbi:hypothetical protein DLN99_08870 [Salmonella enterica]|nr:hypothetical protein [Salmonella enterica]
MIVHSVYLNSFRQYRQCKTSEKQTVTHKKGLPFFGDLIENPRVLGSIPSPGTTYSENPAYGWVFAFLGMEIRSPHLWSD